MKAPRHKEGEDSKSANACIDALIWVGSSPNKTETVNEYLKEAKLRGCCRRLPFIPSWAEFGKTKVFLAHRGKHKVPSRGSIFGYFVLHRIEIITKNEVAQSLPKKKYKTSWPRNIKDYATRIKKWRKKGYSEQKIKRRLKKRLQTQYIKDFAKGETSEELDPELPEELKDLIDEWKEFIEEVIREILQKLFEIGTRKRDNGKIDTLGCFPSEKSRRAEGHRMCSIRKGPGSIYAVDALCATIHDTYQQLLREYLYAESKNSGTSEEKVLDRLQRENQESMDEWIKYKRNHKWKLKELLEMYKGPFHDAVKKHFRSDRQPKYPIDPRLKGKARHYGELVVFKKPFPILEKEPQAAFLGVCHIDGDKLIDQIANHRGKKALVPKIYYCNGELQQIATKKELVTWLTQELHVSSACAARFLDEMAQTTRDQLEEFNKFKLPGIGTIRLKEKRGQKKITFYPFKTLRSIKPQKN
jgi:nucleoid DNA-binding protein/DNA-binding transcriptional MerR regulator